MPEKQLKSMRGHRNTGTREIDLIREMQHELFLKEKEGWFRIISGSMRPLIEIHDRVLARRVSPREVAPGDIILFKNNGLFVTHRVIKTIRHDGETMILQRGDAGRTVCMISPDSILGKVVAIEKNGRLLRLDSGRLRIVNGFLWFKCLLSYRLDLKIHALRQRGGVH